MLLHNYHLPGIQEKLGILNNGEVYAVFAYGSQQPDELSFDVNDRLTILRKGDDSEREWWWAKCTPGREGYVPRNLLGVCWYCNEKLIFIKIYVFFLNLVIPTSATATTNWIAVNKMLDAKESVWKVKEILYFKFYVVFLSIKIFIFFYFV